MSNIYKSKDKTEIDGFVSNYANSIENSLKIYIDISLDEPVSEKIHSIGYIIIVITICALEVHDLTCFTAHSTPCQILA